MLILAAALHADWHLARPLGERLSLAWSQHWLFCAVCLGLAGWHLCRRWSDQVWQAAAWNVGLAVILAQLVEPWFESIGYHETWIYDVEPARWIALGQCVAAGFVAFPLGVAVARWRR